MNPIKLVALFVVSLGLMACGSSDTNAPNSTLVDVFDGAALGCNVSSNGMTATESGNGAYTFNPGLPEGAITTATGCTDSDTQSLLPELLGVSQSGAMVISPITTLIVEDVIAKAVDVGVTESQLRAGVLTISPIALTDATSRIVTNLGLDGYKPTDPEQANYIAAAKADPTGSSVAAVAMRTSLAVSTLLKSVEVSAGAANARVAVAAVSKAIAGLTGAVDLTEQSVIEGVMTTAKGIAPSVATSIQTASDSISGIVATISSTTGDIDTAIAATTTVSEFLNTATETTITDSAAIVQLTNSVEVAIGASITTPNLAPTASAGTDQTVISNAEVTLRGTGSSDSDGNGYGGLLHRNKNQDDDGVCVSMEVDGGLANKRIAQLRSDALRFVDYDGVPKRILVRKRNKRRRVLVAAVACHEMDDGEVGEGEEVAYGLGIWYTVFHEHRLPPPPPRDRGVATLLGPRHPLRSRMFSGLRPRMFSGEHPRAEA